MPTDFKKVWFVVVRWQGAILASLILYQNLEKNSMFFGSSIWNIWGVIFGPCKIHTKDPLFISTRLAQNNHEGNKFQKLKSEMVLFGLGESQRVNQSLLPPLVVGNFKSWEMKWVLFGLGESCKPWIKACCPLWCLKEGNVGLQWWLCWCKGKGKKIWMKIEWNTVLLGLSWCKGKQEKLNENWMEHSAAWPEWDSKQAAAVEKFMLLTQWWWWVPAVAVLVEGQEENLNDLKEFEHSAAWPEQQ